MLVQLADFYQEHENDFEIELTSPGFDKKYFDTLAERSNGFVKVLHSSFRKLQLSF